MQHDNLALDLFDAQDGDPLSTETFADGAVLLRGFVGDDFGAVIGCVAEIEAAAPFRRMFTPGGFQMSVAIANCGDVGWVSDRSGYRYSQVDPQSGLPWPSMPEALSNLALRAAAQAGYGGFLPDTCLINCYEPGARMSLHQDRNERDFDRPIVSVSLGLPATFLFGGLQRTDKPMRRTLQHGDIVVWGGPSRLAFHGVTTLKDGDHPAFGRRRINLTFRKAL